MSYSVWIQKVDKAMYSVASCGIFDIPDYDYMAAFEDRLAPKRVAMAALRAAGWR